MYSTQNRGGKQIIRMANKKYEKFRNNLNNIIKNNIKISKKYEIATNK